MKHTISIAVIALVSVGFAQLLGLSETAGLFGAIIGVGSYAANNECGAA